MLVLWGHVPQARADDRSSLVHTPPERHRVGQRLEVEGTLLSSNGVDRLFIRYRSPGSPWRESKMELAFGDLYRGDIPADAITDAVLEYYVEAEGAGGARTEIFASESRPVSVEIRGGRAVESAQRPGRDTSTGTSTRTSDDSEWARADAARAQRLDRDAGQAGTDARTDATRSGSGDRAMVSTPSGSSEARTTRGSSAPMPVAKPAPRPATPFDDDAALYGAVDDAALARIHQPADVTTIRPTVVLDRAELTRLGVKRVTEALETVPGLTVTRDVQGAWNVGVRGLRNNAQILFLRDGVPLNSAWNAGPLGLNVPVENLERIEITLGPGAVAYGGTAVLGVINLVSRTDAGARVMARAGSHGAVNGSANGALQLGPIRLRADVDVQRQDGYSKDVLLDSISELTEAQDLRRLGDPVGVTRDWRNLIHGGLGASFGLPGDGELSASARVFSESRAVLMGQFDTAGNLGELGADPAGIDNLGILGDLAFKQPIGETANLKARAWLQQQDVKHTFQLTPRGYRSQADDPTSAFEDGVREKVNHTSRELGAAVWAEAVVAEAHHLTFGLSGTHQSLTGYEYLANYGADGRPTQSFDLVVDASGRVQPKPFDSAGLGTSRISAALWAEERWRALDRLEIDLGVRVDAVQLPLSDGAGGFSGTQFVPSLNPRLGVAVQALDGLMLRAGWARAFRAPTIAELTERLPSRNLIFGRGRFTGNPELQAASVDTVSASADYLQNAGFGRVRLRGEAFFSYISGAIDGVDSTGSDTPWSNRTGVRVFGAEGSASLELTSRMRVFMNGSVSRAQDLDTPAAFRLLTHVPQATMNAGASFPMGPFLNLDLRARIVAERRNNARTELELLRRFTIPGHGVVTAQIRSEPLFGHLEAVLLGQNVMNTPTFDDVPRPDGFTGLVPREGFEAFFLLRGWL